MTGHRIRGQMFLLAPNAIQEIAMMCRQIGPTSLLRDQLVAWAVQLPAHRVSNDEHALGAVEGGAVLVSLLHVGGPDALLENELLPASPLPFASVLEDRILGIGELLVIIEEILASQ